MKGPRASPSGRGVQQGSLLADRWRVFGKWTSKAEMAAESYYGVPVTPAGPAKASSTPPEDAIR